MQRHTRAHPCAVCGGYDEARRGKGERCFGFISDDGEWEHCTREDLAGGLAQQQDSQTYAHRMHGSCRCGQEHGPAIATAGNGGRIVCTYNYTDENGGLLYQVVRYSPKNFRQRRPDGHGGWIWNLHGVRRVLYHLPEVLEASVLFVVEGERDVETLREWGFPATTNAGGAKAPWLLEYTETLRGREVIVIPDNDATGWERAATVSRHLLGHVARLQIFDLPEGIKDISDWFAAGKCECELIARLEGVHAV
jgi:hypothetical protein